jgi:hypothetical protein
VKHDELRSIAHNVADSLASGVGLPIGVYFSEVFREAESSPEKSITIDFLKGTIVAGRASSNLAKAVNLYCDVLADLYAKQRASVSQFRVLTARYSADNQSERVLVTIEDGEGRRSLDEYVAGGSLRHIKTVDPSGRIRTLRKPRPGKPSK